MKKPVPKAPPTDECLVLINPRKVPLTPDVLRTFNGFEEMSDKEGLDICHTSLTLAHLILDFLARKKDTFIDNQEVVDLKSERVAPVVEMSRSKSAPHKNKAA